MPIINPRKRSTKKAEPVVALDTTPTPESPSATPPAQRNIEKATPPPEEAVATKKKSNALICAVALILGIAISIGGFLLYTDWKQTQIDQLIAEEQAAEEQKMSFDITNNLDVYEKVSSLTSLTKRELEANTVALIETKQTPDSSVLISALEVIVGKNRQDLASYKERLIEILLELHGFNTLNAASVKEQITARSVDAGLRESKESVRLLTLLDKILEGVPEGTELEEYFKVAIDDVL